MWGTSCPPTYGSNGNFHDRLSCTGPLARDVRQRNLVKSVHRGGREYPASDASRLATRRDLPSRLRAKSTNFASLKVTVRGEPRSTQGVLFFFWIDGTYGPTLPVSPGPQLRDDRGGRSGWFPGRHLVCAFVGVQSWMTPQSSSDFGVLRPAPESHCQTTSFSKAKRPQYQRSKRRSFPLTNSSACGETRKVIASVN